MSQGRCTVQHLWHLHPISEYLWSSPKSTSDFLLMLSGESTFKKWCWGPALWNTVFSCCLPCKHPILKLLQIPAALLLIQSHANKPGEGGNDGLNIWFTVTDMGDFQEAPGSWLQPILMPTLSLSLTLSSQSMNLRGKKKRRRSGVAREST